MENLEEKMRVLQAREQLQNDLPHLYSFKFYAWARKYFESTNPVTMLCAANQISKSSTNIRKLVHWSTEDKLWPHLWRTVPRLFWYMYPSKQLATQEFETKWVPEFMPRGKMENHPKYGWTAKYKAGEVEKIVWKNGPPTYFKTYSQDVHKIQAATLWACFVDEEIPEDMLDEVMLRLVAQSGYFNLCFTATRGQAIFYKAMERIGKRDETFKNAMKIHATMYDCLKYEDGDTNTPWTKEKIQGVIDNCATENAVKKRVFGRFVMDEGLRIPSFSRARNVVEEHEIDKDWHIYSAVDIGSGGKGGHPAAMTFVAVSPDYKKGIVYKGWKGNKMEITTSTDILEKYRMLRGSQRMVTQWYDWAAKDFHTFASRLGETFTPADKNHERGFEILNTLFKNKMLDIFDTEELEGLPIEIEGLTKDVKKQNAKDDYIDTVRYIAAGINWNWEAAVDRYKEAKIDKKTPEMNEVDVRRGMMFEEKNEDEIEAELAEWNEMYDN